MLICDGSILGEASVELVPHLNNLSAETRRLNVAAEDQLADEQVPYDVRAHQENFTRRTAV